MEKLSVPILYLFWRERTSVLNLPKLLPSTIMCFPEMFKTSRNRSKSVGLDWLPSFLPPAVLNDSVDMFPVLQSFLWLSSANKSFLLNSSVSVFIQLRFSVGKFGIFFYFTGNVSPFTPPPHCFLDRFHFPDRCVSFSKMTSMYSRLFLFLSAFYLVSFLPSFSCYFLLIFLFLVAVDSLNDSINGQMSLQIPN